MLLACSVEVTLSTWDSSTQFRLRRVLGKCTFGKMKSELAFLPPGILPVASGSFLLKVHFTWIIQSILGKCAQVIHKLMFVMALPGTRLSPTSEVGCYTLAKNHLGPCHVVSDLTSKQENGLNNKEHILNHFVWF